MKGYVIGLEKSFYLFHIFSIWMKRGFSLPQKRMKFRLHSWNLLNLETVYHSCTVDSICTGNQCDTSDFRFGKQGNTAARCVLRPLAGLSSR